MGRPKQLAKAQYETLAAFRYALRLFLRFSEKAARNAGITQQQHQALLAVKGFPGREWVTISELAERLQLRHHSAVGLVNRLVGEKMLSREPVASDRRRVIVRLTDRGEGILAALSKVHRSELKRIGPSLNLLLRRLRRLK